MYLTTYYSTHSSNNTIHSRTAATQTDDRQTEPSHMCL